MLAESGASFSTWVPAGTYRLRLEDLHDKTELPPAWLGADSVVVGSDPLSVELDLAMRRVRGTITLNGHPPSLTVWSPCSGAAATVTFTHQGSGTKIHEEADCSTLPAELAFDVTLPVGSYAVDVTGTPRATIPSVRFRVADTVVVE